MNIFINFVSSLVFCILPYTSHKYCSRSHYHTAIKLLRVLLTLITFWIKYLSIKVLSPSAPRGHAKGEEASLHSFLTSALNEGTCSTSCLSRFNPRKEPRYPLKWGWVGPTAGLDILEEKKSFPCRY